jgi:hypothetical protein
LDQNQFIPIVDLGEVVDFFNGSRKFTPVKVDLLEIFASETNKYSLNDLSRSGLSIICFYN